MSEAYLTEPLVQFGKGFLTSCLADYPRVAGYCFLTGFPSESRSARESSVVFDWFAVVFKVREFSNVTLTPLAAVLYTTSASMTK